MMHRVFVSILVLTALWSSTALSQRRRPAPPKATAPAADEPPPVLAVPKEYKYDSRGRRDPFINPIPKPVATTAAIPSVRPPGLKGVLVAEAGIAGVVTSKEPSMNVVIINAPAGRTYFARIGDELFDAVVKEIRLDTVTFALNTSAPTESATPREIVRKVRPTPGE
jgi:hypothetical protein